MPTGVINLLNTSNAPAVNADRLYNLNNALYFAGSQVLTASNIVAGTGLQKGSVAADGTFTLSTTTSPYSSVGSFFQLPIFAINSPTTAYQFMNINSSSYSVDHITYIIPKTMTLKNITIISNDITDQYLVKITNLNTTISTEETISMSSNTEVKQALNTTRDFTEGHKMTIEIKKSSGTLTTEEVLVMLDGELVQTSIWTYDTNKTYYADGNVGIGTDVPDKKLHIRGNGPQLLIEGLTNEDAIISSSSGPSYRNTNHQICFSHYAALNNDVLNFIDFKVNTGEQTTPETKMRIRGDGNVGIGTDVPDKKLHIRGNGPQLLIEGLTNEDAIISSSSGPSYRNRPHHISFQHYALPGNGYRNYMHFKVNTGAETTPDAKMTIRGDGNVGIGTDNPLNKLDIATTDSYTQCLISNNSLSNPGQIIIRNNYYNKQIQLRTAYNGSNLHSIFTYNGSGPDDLDINGGIKINGDGNVVIYNNLIIGSDTTTTGQITCNNITGGYGNASDNFHIDNHTNAGQMLINYSNEMPVRLFNAGTTGSLLVYTQNLDPIFASSNTNPTTGWISRIRLNNSVSNQDVFMAHYTNIHGTSTGIFAHYGSMGSWNYLYLNCLRNDASYIACDGQLSIMDSAWIGCDINSGNASQGNDRLLTLGRSTSYQYGMKFGGFTHAAEYGNAVFQISMNLHIDSPNNGASGAGNIYLNHYNSGMNIYLRSTAYFSDRRLKKDFEDINDDEVLNLCENINITKYKYKDDIRNPLSDRIYGFIAQDVQKYYPQAITINKGNNPHIMQEVSFTINNEIITVDYNFDLSKEYLIYGYTDINDINYKHLEEIKPITINSFKNPHKDYEFVKLVIVGTYIDDKLSISKEKLFQVFCGGVIALKHKYEQLENQDFTGKHRCITNNKRLTSYYQNYIGQIVISTGKHNTKNIISNKNKDHITINDSLPIVDLSNKINQKNVLGIISGIYNQRIIVNSIGEGAIWIINTNGNLENGDYITTSILNGYGHKQDDDLLHNYTVAKITLDCNFDINSDEYECKEIVLKAQIYKKAFVPCIYFCG